MKENSKTRVLTESAVFISMAVVLSIIPLFQMPLGGKVTAFSTLPIIAISLRHGAKWGVPGALVYSLIQLVLGASNVAAVPVRTLGYMVLCALLDYVIGYTLIGFTGAISRRFRSRTAGICAGTFITGCARLFCCFLSGILIWAPYTPEGWNSAVWYSLAYNASWCLPDLALVLAACLLLANIKALNLFPKNGSAA